MSDRTALVTGATGVAGGALVRHLAGSGWRVIAVSRRAPSFTHERVIPVSADLTDRAALEAALKPHRITHAFHMAFVPEQKPKASGSIQASRKLLRTMRTILPVIDAIPPLRSAFYTQIAKSSGASDPHQRNLTMLRHVVEVTRGTLTHVGLVTGGKTYGMHLTPYLHRKWRIPFHESTARAPGPNMYYEMEDYLSGDVSRMGITWTILRPAFLIGDNPHAQYNLLVALAVYASLLKARSMPLIFPGDAASAACLHELTDADLMARMFEWAALTPAAHNHDFNVSNGQPIRWKDLWSAFAANFGGNAVIEPSGFDTRAFFEDDASNAAWDRLVGAHGLQPHTLPQITSSDALDLAFVQDWDVIFSMDKARGLGFMEQVDAAEMFTRHIDRLREQKLIP